MAETLRIEIPIETIDNTDPELSNVTKNFQKMEKAAESANNSAKKAGSTVTQFDKQAQKTEKSLASWAKQKYEILLEAKERISPVLSTIGSGLKSFTKKTWSVTMRAVDFITAPVRGIINLLKNPVFQVGAVLGVSIGLKDTIETYKNFEAAMSKVEAVSGATASEMNKLTEKAKEMGATTKFTAAESAEAFNYMAMAGWKTEDMLGGIEGILSLAAASGESLATTSDIVTDALTAFGMKASDAGHFSDVMAAASSNANTNVSMMGETFKYAGAMAGTLKYSIEDVALATGLMANAGIKGNMAGTALNSIFTRLSTNTNGATDALNNLGIAYFNADGSARDFSDIMEELRAATADFTDEQKANLGHTIAGTYAQKGFLAILNATTEDYEKLSKAIDNSDGAAARMAEIMMDNLQGSITLLQSAADGVKLSFGKRLSPYIRNLADWLTEQMPAVEQNLDELMDWVDTKIDRMQRRFNELTRTKKWQDADFLGKVKISWDEFIAKPFSEWWNSTGKAVFAEFAQDIGSGIGTGLKAGIMTLLGIDIGETLDEGVSIGASFAKGFSSGFDFETISKNLWDGFKNLLSSAGKLLPGGESAGLSSVFSAMLLGKIVRPFIGLGRGTASIGKALFGTNAATGTSLAGSFLGSAAAGTGLLGKSALMAIDLGAGKMAGGASMSAGALSATGLAAGAGAVVGGATLISGASDMYAAIKANKDGNGDKAGAYAGSGGWKIGGVAAGAATGALIGSVIPVIGTAVGAMAGAGIGGIAGWLQGNKVKEKYQKNVKEMQEEAENAQKVFEATGFAIDDIRFKNTALQQAMKDSSVSASQFAKMFQEECAKVAENAFGDISLSLKEVKKLAEEITFGDMAGELNKFAQAAADTDSALTALQSSVISLKKENWKVSLGMELSETEKDGYKGAIEDFISRSQTYIDDNHYEAVAALKLLAGNGADTSGTDSYYSDLKSQLEELSSELTNQMSVKMNDSIITLDEAKELESLQEQISAITTKLSQARTDAKMQKLKIKYDGAALDADSFKTMQEELKAYSASAAQEYDDALELTLTNLELQHNDNAISTSEYYDAIKEAEKQYNDRMGELNVRVSSFSLENIAAAWSSGLDKYMPEVEGTTAEKLSVALNNAILAHPDINAWEASDVAKWMGLDKLDFDSAQLSEIGERLKQTALAVPNGTKKKILHDFKMQVPSVDEIKEAIDFTDFTWNDYEQLFGGSGPNMNMLTGNEHNFEGLKDIYAKNIHDALNDALDPAKVSEFVNKYMQAGSAVSKHGPISDDYYIQMITDWKKTGTECGDSFSSGASSSLLSASPLWRINMQAALDSATNNPFTVSPAVNINPAYNVTSRPSLPGYGLNLNTSGISGHAGGGYVSGGPQLSWLAEEGYGEFIIPTAPSRRSAALDLYEQAGAALGVSAYAAGGFIPGNNALDYNFFNRYYKDAPRVYNEATGYDYDNALSYEPVMSSERNTEGGVTLKINVNMAPEFVINGDSQDEESIMQIIRQHLNEMADELGGEIAQNLSEVFSNMPLKEA